MNQPPEQSGPQPQQWPAQPPPPQQQWPAQPPPPPQQQWPAQPLPQHPQQQWMQPQPQPQQAYQPPQPAGATIGTHLKRAFEWNVAAIVPTPREQQALDEHHVDPLLRGLLVWRRSTLLVAMPVLVLSVVLSFIQAANTDKTYYTGFGKLLLFLPPIALLLVPLGSLFVMRRWTELRRSSRSLVVLWVISIAVPLFVALVPLDYVIDLTRFRADYQVQVGSVAGLSGIIFASRLSQAIHFALTLLPVVLSVPGGVLKGAGRIKSMFPSAALPGWFLVAVAPFYSMFMIVVFVLVDQIVGNGLLLIGVGLLAFTPWMFVIHRKVYGRPLSMQESRTELARASRGGGWLTIAGLVFIAIFLFSTKIEGTPVIGSNSNKAVFSYVQVLRTVGEVLSRGMVTAVVFSTIFLYVVYAEWKTITQLRPDIRAEHDSQIRALQHYIEGPAG